jgi:DNA-directed RNA polymerase specialized sigma24 family protein
MSDFTDIESIEGRFEKLLEALEQCIEKLSPENRDLIIHYYKGERSEKIKNRKAIAKRLKIPPNALRIRAHRIREKLERAIEDRLR